MADNPVRLPSVLRSQVSTGDMVSLPVGDTRGVRGLIYDDRELNADLRWPLSTMVFDTMAVDPQVHGLLRSVMLPILKAERMLSDGDQAIIDFLRVELGLPEDGKPLRRRQRQGIRFGQFLEEALTVLTYGHAVFEQVYEAGPPAPGQESVGKRVAHLRKLAYIHPRQIADWRIHRHGSLEGVVLDVFTDKGAVDAVYVPIETLIVFNFGRIGSNWWGRSFLRPLYKPWYLKDVAERLGAVALDRGAVGIPHIQFGDGGSMAGAQKIGRDMRSGDSTFVAHALGAYTVELLGVRSAELTDPLPWIKHHEQAMSKAWTAQVMDLGHDGGLGSGNLSETFFQMFADGVNAIADTIAEVISEHIIRDLVDLNFGEGAEYPTFSFSRVTPSMAAESLAALVNANIITPNEEMERALRVRYGLPHLADGARAAHAEQQAAMAADAAKQMADAVPPDPAASKPGDKKLSDDMGTYDLYNAYHDKAGRFTSGSHAYTASGAISSGGLVKRLHESGGFTYNPIAQLSPTRGFMVSPYPQREHVIEGKVTGRDIMRYVRHNADLLGQPGHFLGGWFDESSGKTYLDVSVRAKSGRAAARLAKTHNQYAYFDLGKMRTVNVPGREG